MIFNQKLSKSNILCAKLHSFDGNHIRSKMYDFNQNYH